MDDERMGEPDLVNGFKVRRVLMRKGRGRVKSVRWKRGKRITMGAQRKAKPILACRREQWAIEDAKSRSSVKGTMATGDSARRAQVLTDCYPQARGVGPRIPPIVFLPFQ